jgi:phosphatidylglycerophosphatase A
MSLTGCAGLTAEPAKMSDGEAPERLAEPGQAPQKTPLRSMIRTPWAWAVSTVFGAGFLKPGPGTWASVMAVLLWLLFAGLASPTPPALRAVTLLAALVAIVAGIPAATVVEFESDREDPGHVVIDEVAGQWIALLAFCGDGHQDWEHALLALLLFRFFDILKPPPVRQLERLHGGVGILMDDAAAGVYALIVGAMIGHWW